MSKLNEQLTISEIRKNLAQEHNWESQEKHYKELEKHYKAQQIHWKWITVLAIVAVIVQGIKGWWGG